MTHHAIALFLVGILLGLYAVVGTIEAQAIDAELAARVSAHHATIDRAGE